MSSTSNFFYLFRLFMSLYVFDFLLVHLGYEGSGNCRNDIYSALAAVLATFISRQKNISTGANGE